MMKLEETLPPGFRFHPTDEELITYYLSRKVSDSAFTSKAVAEVDLNKCEPWDLPAKASMGEKEWYFFSLRDRKYPTGLRTNRATEAGYWKTTGKDKEIYRAGELVGMKKTLVFYKGRAPRGDKSNWVMHEYRLDAKLSFKPTKEEWVVCRIFQKSSSVKKPQQLPSSPPSLESPSDTNPNAILNDFSDIELANLNTSIANSSNGFANISAQNYDIDNSIHLDMNMNMNMNWPAAPTLPWPSNLLSSNLSMNSLLLKALQFRSYQQREPDYSFLPQEISQFGNELSSNFTASSSSKVLDPALQDQQQDRPFNLDNIW